MKTIRLLLLISLSLCFLCLIPIPKVYGAITITYNAGTDTITAKGGSEGSEIRTWDIWNASTVNNWNVTCQTCENATKGMGQQNIQYFFSCKLQIGDGSTETWYASEGEQLLFTKNVAETFYGYGGHYAPKTHIRFGQLDPMGRASNGTDIIFLDYANAKTFRTYNVELEIYDSRIAMIGDASSNDPISIEMSAISDNGVLVIKGSRIEYTEKQRLTIDVQNAQIDGLELYNLTLLVNDKPDYTWTDISIFGQPQNHRALTAQFAQPLTIRGLTISQDNPSNNEIDLYGNCHLELINPIWNFSKISFVAPVNTEWAKIQWTFRINVTNINGVPIENANVTFTDSEGTQEFTVLTGSNGSFSERIVTSHLYNATGGVTPYLLTPHTLTITHANYSTLEYLVTINEWKVLSQVALTQKSFSSGIGGGLVLGLSIMIIAVIAVGVKKKRG